jgi:uncharacterized protein
MIPVTDPEAVANETSSVPYVLPFAAFVGMLSVSPHLRFLGVWEYPIGVVVLAALIWYFSRHVLHFRIRKPLLTVAIGIGVFAIWIAPETLFPAYRQHWLFSNFLTGALTVSISDAHRSEWFVLASRTVRAAVLVPIIEELFWRAWLMRWLIRSDIATVPLGAWTWSSMAISVALFGSEHGPYWEVGLIAGLAYNVVMIRTRSLGDCIFAHAVTNGLLSAYVIATGKWHYWG